MAYLSGSIPAVSGSATALPNPGFSGMVVQNLSTSTVAYLGGPFVTAGNGVVLGTTGQALVLPGRHAVVTPADVTDAPYVITSSGTAPIVYTFSAT